MNITRLVKIDNGSGVLLKILASNKETYLKLFEICSRDDFSENDIKELHDYIHSDQFNGEYKYTDFKSLFSGPVGKPYPTLPEGIAFSIYFLIQGEIADEEEVLLHKHDN